MVNHLPSSCKLLQSRKGIAPIAAALLVLLLIVVVYFAYTTYSRPPPSPAALSFSLTLPKAIAVGQSVTVLVSVANNGTDAKDVAAFIISDAMSSVSETTSVKHGAQALVKVSVSGKDVQDGSYGVKVYLQYSDETGSHTTASKETSIYLFPNIELTDARFQPDLFHPLGKGTIGKTDSTTLLFKVHSKSNAVVYSGTLSKAVFSISVPGISIDPSSITVEPIGPNGRTGDYGFNITSDNAPPGTYNIILSLHSKENQLIMQNTIQLVVAG